GLGERAERFTSGVAPWRVAELEGLTWGGKLNRSYHVIGSSAEIDMSRFDASRAKWVHPAVVRAPIEFHPCGIVARGWRLHGSALPEQRHDRWQGGRVRGILGKWFS